MRGRQRAFGRGGDDVRQESGEERRKREGEVGATHPETNVQGGLGVAADAEELHLRVFLVAAEQRLDHLRVGSDGIR